MNSLRIWTFALILHAILSTAQGVSGQSRQTQPNSAENLPSSATHAANRKTETDAALAACSNAADELAAARELNALLEEQRQLLKNRLEAEKQIAGLALELAESRRLETEALRRTADAKDEAIAALRERIALQEKMIAGLGRRKTSIWRRLGDVMIGIAAGAILK